MEKKLKGKKIAVVVPQKNFWEEEAEVVAEKLDALGVEFFYVAELLEPCIGLRRNIIKPDITYEDFDPLEFDGIIFLGGPGARIYGWEKEQLMEAVKKLQNVRKPLLALTTAPVILAKAGLLEHKKATVFPDYNAVSLFEDYKVIYEKEPIVQSDLIITTNHRDATAEAIERFIKLL